ncbi:MAG: bifunctional DNA primase/polymerase [Candidatus Thermoplasmatota archaeon]|nr:bifunctional DNA primase/polymerase [Candidatus Thermoplasmatota archaeon]
MIVNGEVWGANPKIKEVDENSYVSSEKSFITVSTTDLDRHQTQAAKAVNYTRKRWRIFPCDTTKAPIVDRSLGFVHGVKDATSDTKIIAKTWFRYPDAAIGFAIPPDIIVIDCDVKKDSQKRPVSKHGFPDRTGLRSFQALVMDLKITGDDLRTLSVRTQSGGTHFYFLMPNGISSFNRTGALPGLDLKGDGGYVILPNSQGQYGRYEFLNLAEIRKIPAPLLTWIMQFKEKPENHKILRFPSGNGNVDREEIIRTLKPYWDKADGKRNDLTLAIAGFIARSGGTEADAIFIISKLCEITKKGYDHIPGAKYAFRREGKIRGFRTLTKIMEEINDDEQ